MIHPINGYLFRALNNLAKLIVACSRPDPSDRVLCRARASSVHPVNDRHSHKHKRSSRPPLAKVSSVEMIQSRRRLSFCGEDDGSPDASRPF
jgi:hypothetical protein